VGTASNVRRWLLLEQPGPWGYDATAANRLPRALARAIQARTEDLGIRLILLRRPAGRRTARGAHCFFALTDRGEAWLQHVHLEDAAAVLDIDLSPMLDGHAPTAGVADEEPLFLVCTNGRRDPCCAERGRPVARALDAAFGARVWECSHIGGDRFAANVVCFPGGVYFGRVLPDEAVDIARRFHDGVLDLDHYRGTSRYGFAVQAAEILARRRTGIDGVRDLPLIEASRRGRTVTASFVGPDDTTVTETVDILQGQTARRLTCHGRDVHRPPTYVEVPGR
jgi:hypothetical protein